ncbi:MAG: hypothetical protein WAO55_04470 [Candidatus Manganitrophaceae bacterium]
MEEPKPKEKRYQHDLLEDKHFRPAHLSLEDQLLLKAISNAEFLDLLRREHPKIHDRMRGKLESAKRELIRLYKKQQRRELCREVQRLELDPNEPLPADLVAHHELDYQKWVGELERQLDQTICPIFSEIKQDGTLYMKEAN